MFQCIIFKIKLKSNNGNNSEQELERDGIKNRIIRGKLKFHSNCRVRQIRTWIQLKSWTLRTTTQIRTCVPPNSVQEHQRRREVSLGWNFHFRIEKFQELVRYSTETDSKYSATSHSLVFYHHVVTISWNKYGFHAKCTSKYPDIISVIYPW